MVKLVTITIIDGSCIPKQMIKSLLIKKKPFPLNCMAIEMVHN